MNLGIAALGVVAGAAIGAALSAQQRRERARWATLTARGVESEGQVCSSVSTGRYAAYRRVTIEVDGRRFVETMPAAEASTLGVVDGAVVRVVYLADAGSAPALGRVVRARSVDRDLPVGWFAGAFIGVLGVLAGMVV